MGPNDLELLSKILGALVAALCGVLWWNFRGQSADVKDLKDSFSKHQLYVANHCAKHSDLERTANQFERVAERIEQKLDNLFQILDRKADK